jgi:hypothetical protein
MKKIFVAVLAVAAMVACSTEQTIVAPQGEAIGFDTFVENATRADITTDNLAEFGVYASIEKGNSAGMILTNEKVYKNANGAWTYGNTQYWVPQANYEFTAFAPYTGGHWAYAPDTTADNGDVTFNNKAAAADQDFIFAAADMNLTNVEALTKSPGVVNFTFAHQLSKVAFKFNNDFDAVNNITLRVYNVNVAGLVSEATTVVDEGATGVWTKTATSDTFARTFGTQVATGVENKATIIAAQDNIVTDYHYFIPVAGTEYTISFDVDIIQAGVKVDTYHHTNLKVTPALDKGGNYVFTTTLDASNVSDDPTKQLYPIEFNVTGVEGWDPANGNVDVLVPATGNN